MSTQWLPALVLLADSSGDWGRYVEHLYAYFVADFEIAKPSWPGKRVGLKRHPEYDGKSATFWHFLSDGADEAERIPDLRRCERIRWPRPMMDGFNQSKPDLATARMIWWKNRRSNEDRYLLALPDFSYIVVVADRGEFVLPWTAYTVDRDHQRNKLKKDFEFYWEARKAEAAPKGGPVTPSTRG